MGFGLSGFDEPISVWNAEPLVAAPATLREVQRFGSEDGDSEASFYWILALAVDSSGDLYAYDRDRGVKRFGADGEYRGLVAGHGSGPGEVLGVHAITATSDGALIIHDPGNNRLQVFEPEGEIRTIRQPLGYRVDSTGRRNTRFKREQKPMHRFCGSHPLKRLPWASIKCM